MVAPTRPRCAPFPFTRRWAAAALLVCVASGWCTACFAQGPADAAAAVTTSPAAATTSAAKKDDSPAIEAIEQRCKELRTQYAAKPDEKLKADLIAELAKRTAYYIKGAADYESQKRRFDREFSNAPAELQRIEQELKAPAETPAVSLPAEAKQAELDALVEQRQKDVEEARRQKDKHLQRKKALDARGPKLDEESRTLRDLQEQTKPAAASPQASGSSAPPGATAPPAAGPKAITDNDPQDLVDARKASYDAKRLWMKSWSDMLASERQGFDAAKNLVEQKLKLADAQLRRAEQVFKLTSEQVTQRRRDAAQSQVRTAKADAQHESQPLLRELAEKNADLAERRVKTLALAQQVSTELEQRSAELKSLQDMSERTHKMVDTVGLTGAVGMLLRNQRTRLPSADFYRQNLRGRQETTRSTQYDQLVLEDQRRELDRAWAEHVAEQQAAVVTAAGVAEGSPHALALGQRTETLLTTKKELIDLLVKDNERYFKRLVELDVEEQKLIDESQQFGGYLDERILWVRSTDPFRATDPASAAHAAVWLFGPAAWPELGGVLLREVYEKPEPAILLTLLVFLPWLAVQRRLRKRLIDLGKIASARTTQQFSPTVEAVLLTLLLAGFVPAILWFLAWQLQRSTAGTELTASVAEGLQTVAQLLLPLACLRQMCRPKGLAEAHLNWKHGVTSLLAGRLGRLVWVGMPLVYVAAAMHRQENISWDASLGRGAFIGLMLVFAKVLHALLRPSGVLVRELADGKPDSWVFRLRHLAFALGIVGPLGGAALAALGFYYSSWQLAVCCVSTIYLGVGLTIVSALVRRWLTLSHRRMAMEQRRKALREQMLANSDAGAAASAAGIVTELPPELDLTAVNEQTRRLLNVVLLAIAVCGGWLIWGSVLPALNALDQIPLWTTMDEGHARAVTLGNVLLGLLALVITGAAARNVPGLLQVTVLQRLPIDSAMRYALDNVSRYIIVVAGAAVGLSAIGVGWAKVQWLIAAVSVGLGFGLQEIFANFVSGLIVLFEQPIRVGDIVTIDGTTGVVSKIRIRATTITNWDRQELIVPNKDLITGKLLNWTLSDSVNRVVVNVGVAYGADTRQVHKLLMDISRRQPGVMREPGPTVSFESFGDSTLNFVLRAYLDNLDNRRDVVHELHMAINDEFARAGIEIAFPQRDIHIRSVTMPQGVQAGDLSQQLAGPQGIFGATMQAAPAKKAG